MEKLNVLLVDDEFLVRKGLTAILMQQESVGIELRSASDSYEALDIARGFRPDVVITDINMPEMSGLELIERMTQQGVGCEYLIITGHERFDYAKKAMELGAADYLVKPINKAALIKRLEQSATRKANAKIAALGYLRNSLFSSEADGECTLDVNAIRSLLPCRHLVLCVSIADDPPDRARLGHFFEQVICFRQGRISVCVLNLQEAISREEVRNALTSALGATASSCWGNSDEVELADDIQLQRLYRQAFLDLILRQYGMEDGIRRAILRYVKQERTPTHHFLFLNSKTKLKEWLHDMMQNMPACEGYNREHVAYVCIFSSTAMLFQINSMGHTDLQQIYRIYFEGINAIKTPSDLLKAALSIVEKTNLQLHMGRPRQHRNHSEKISRSIQYIERNYQRDFSLTDIAEEVGMQPSYLSYSFKKEVGESFLQYVHGVRIRHACEMLRNERDASIESIAEQSGYMTTTHFFHVFKDHVGMSPREYRMITASDDQE